MHARLSSVDRLLMTSSRRPRHHDRRALALRSAAHLGLGHVALAVLFLAACAKPEASGTKTAAPEAQAAGPSAEAVKVAARSDALLALANADLGSGRHQRAARRAEAALAEDPKNADAHAILGAARWRAGDVEGSTAAFTQALEGTPQHFGATLGLARNLQARGQHAKAAEMLEALLAEDPTQIDPLLTQMWSYYAVADAVKGTAVVDRIFAHLPAEDPQLPLVQAVAAYFRALADLGPLCTVTGETGAMDAGLSHEFAVKFTSAVVREEFTRVVVSEGREEALVDPELVAKLGLRPLAEFVPLGGKQALPLVLLPGLVFGDLTLDKVPALVSDLEPYTPAVGEKPGVVLGRQALHAFGAYTFDFSANSMTLQKVAPERAPQGTLEVPLVMLSMHVLNIPAVPVRIDGASAGTHLFFGGFERSGVALTERAFLQSGHLPRELSPLDDEAKGLKMVYLRDVELGGRHLGGTGGLVMTHEPPDATLDLVLQNTAFELGGYLNTRMMTSWAVTYVLSQGKLYIRPDVSAPPGQPAD